MSKTTVIMVMDWLEEAGWCYDPGSNSIEQVEYGSPVFGLVSFAVFAVGIPIIFFEVLPNPNLFVFLLVYASCLGLSAFGGRHITNVGMVKRIALSDLSYSVMKRTRRTLENSKINTLKSTDGFTHGNLEVVVVEYEYPVGGEGGSGYATDYQVRLVEKRLVGDGRYFTHHSKRLFKTDESTLPHELRVEPWRLVHNHGINSESWYYESNLAHDVQRMLVLKAKNKTHALELSERFREFFIEGGWKELKRQPSPATSNDVSEEENRPFWE